MGNGLRYYNPTTGRFNREDPARDGSNWQIYVGNDPINNTDPTGMSRSNPFASISSVAMGGLAGAGFGIGAAFTGAAFGTLGNAYASPAFQTPSANDYSNWQLNHRDWSQPMFSGSLYAPSSAPSTYAAWNSALAFQEDSGPGFFSKLGSGIYNAVSNYPNFLGTELSTGGATIVDNVYAMRDFVGDHLSTLWFDPAAERDRFDRAKDAVAWGIFNTGSYVAQHPIQSVIDAASATGNYLNRVTADPEVSGRLVGNWATNLALTGAGGVAGGLVPEWLVGTTRGARIAGELAPTVSAPQTAGLARSAVVSAERAEEFLLKNGIGAERARNFLGSFDGPITARIVEPGETFLRYTDVASSRGSFLTTTQFASPSEAVEGLYLGPYGNNASLVQPITASGRSIVLEGGIQNGGVGVRQTLIIDRGAFQFGEGRGY